MPSFLQVSLNDDAGNTRARVVGIYGILLVLNLAVWFWAVVLSILIRCCWAPRFWLTALDFATLWTRTISLQSTMSPAS